MTMLRPIQTDELPREFNITKHAAYRLKGRFRKLLKNKDTNNFLKKVALEGEFYTAPFISTKGVEYSKRLGRVVVAVIVPMNDDGTLSPVGDITTVWEKV